MNPETPKPIIPLCEHMFTATRRCGSPAMRGMHFCYFHRQRRRERGPEVIPDLVNHRNIQRALSHTLRSLVSGRLTYEEAGRILHGISLAMHSVKITTPVRRNLGNRPGKSGYTGAPDHDEVATKGGV